MSVNANSDKCITFGIRVPNSGPLASLESMVAVAREAESLGYDSIWVHDHLNWSDEIHRTHILQERITRTNAMTVQISMRR